MTPRHAATIELDAFRTMAPHRDDLAEPKQSLLQNALGVARGQVTVHDLDLAAAWQHVFASLLSPGDSVLALRNGPASERWCTWAAAAGLEIIAVDAPWGEPAAYADLERALATDADGRIKAVFVAHHDAELGVATNLAAVRDALDVTDHLALLFADVSGSLGATPLRLARWGVDAAVAGDMAALGGDLAVIARGGRVAPAFPGAAATTLPGRQRLQMLLEHVTAGTAEAARRRYAEAIRLAVTAWGLEPVAGAAVATLTTTALRVPAQLDAARAVRFADGTLSRVGETMGARALTLRHDALDDDEACLALLATVEAALTAAGARFAPNAGVNRAGAWLDATRPVTELAA